MEQKNNNHVGQSLFLRNPTIQKEEEERKKNVTRKRKCVCKLVVDESGGEDVCVVLRALHNRQMLPYSEVDERLGQQKKKSSCRRWSTSSNFVTSTADTKTETHHGPQYAPIHSKITPTPPPPPPKYQSDVNAPFTAACNSCLFNFIALTLTIDNCIRLETKSSRIFQRKLTVKYDRT